MERLSVKLAPKCHRRPRSTKHVNDAERQERQWRASESDQCHAQRTKREPPGDCGLEEGLRVSCATRPVVVADYRRKRAEYSYPYLSRRRQPKERQHEVGRDE